MNTKQVGDETEAKIMAALIAEGYTVSVPFGDNESYDLVLDTGTALKRVQYKTGWIEDDVVRFKTTSKTTSNGEVVRTDYEDKIDAFAVRCRDTEQLYWVPSEDAGAKSTYLRVTEPEIAHPSVNRAEKCRLEDRLPGSANR
ncbi:group I intron-associated PD-(D/E)XK endonuclease [Natronococcus sp.]|uniref:group I intron-associated PD-(D/E)XK endonuclease n=1 Tax=Natronococcus sp. TaxID=35747 RepID=UPI0025E463B9|nr:group I intron-associated PD-(D/E)XK endonuclease [Natronococcus sp.]